MTVALAPLEDRGSGHRSIVCPVCGSKAARAADLPAAVFTTFADGFSFRAGAWVHRECCESCPDAGRPSSVPW